ncbi:hypothetical protein ACFQL1_12455 [Halomicroarcula sp. GCM10025709]|uniref:hypothetical protein n=1 Tax=Haloarcula TaxID=2237 RepID=UPI0024C45FDE|nr:hypothetical protein [Halomicroarcula sp. YJ-61-S]
MVSPVAIRDGTLQATLLLLVAGLLLVGLSLLGVGASLPLAAGLVVLAIGLFLTRPETTVGRVAGVDVDQILRWLWLALVLAAVPLVIRPTATPGEVQSLGGLVGLAGMANYFLRPLYLLGYDISRKLAALGGVDSR